MHNGYPYAENRLRTTERNPLTMSESVGTIERHTGLASVVLHSDSTQKEASD